MLKTQPEKANLLSIFVHRASECLTDHESHGDGLICFSLLNGLALRGHHVYAYTNYAPIQQHSQNLVVKVAKHRIPANSLAAWEHSVRADLWLKDLLRYHPIDLVWRMHPYGIGCPYPPSSYGKPLVLGPLFREWPEHLAKLNISAQTRPGFGLAALSTPFAHRGWQRTMKRADLIICATSGLASIINKEYPKTKTSYVPVIIDVPSSLHQTPRDPPGSQRPFRLVFAANLNKNKNCSIFCETIKLLNKQELNIEAVILGEGPEQVALRDYCNSENLSDVIHFAGKVSHQHVWQFLRDADVLVSCSGFEAYGRTIVEAMAVGTPCVCYSGTGGPGDIIDNGIDGLLTNYLTATSFAQSILCLYNSPQLWQTLSGNALAKAKYWTSNAVISSLEADLINTACAV